MSNTEIQDRLCDYNLIEMDFIIDELSIILELSKQADFDLEAYLRDWSDASFDLFGLVISDDFLPEYVEDTQNETD